MALLRITRSQDQAREDLRYWRARTPAERIAAVELLRRDLHLPLGAPADAEPRLQRVCRVVQRPRG
jgi:hypothetical protein